MTHLSDYSFLQRATGLSYVLIWLIYRVYTTEKFDCLDFSKFKKGELKSIVTALLLVMIPFQLYYGNHSSLHVYIYVHLFCKHSLSPILNIDVISCKIKYEEGFVQFLGRIMTKPESLWTDADKALVSPTDYSLCIGFSLQIGTLLLLQCFWKYLAKLVARARFMSSKEFKFYIIMTVVNIILFPVLQYNFTRDIYDFTYKEIMPQLVYGCEMLVISILGGVSHFRFKKLLRNSKDQNDAQFITTKIRHFQDLNLILSASLFIFSFSFILISADGLTSLKTINRNKFLSDLLICNINISCIVTWVIVILIFHPNKYGITKDRGMSDDEMEQEIERGW
ncbi:MAG: hypothetical protein EXX96DRAFT_607132 [Benjaminiella poitrasii]|nr:MAG: hypothetical protein EXX96DRAFT_607132 [Benjaminiella poitrasii]